MYINLKKKLTKLLSLSVGELNDRYHLKYFTFCVCIPNRSIETGVLIFILED